MTRTPTARARSARSLLLAAPVALLLLGACERPPSEAERLLEEAQLALEQQGTSSESVVAACEAAWPSLEQIGTSHRDSPVAPEAFRLASTCFKRVYDFRRYTVPDSPFVTEEPGFMVEWLTDFFGEEFPQEQVDQLLVGMPYAMFRELQASAENHPALARWEMVAKRENGRVEYVKASPAKGAPAPPPGPGEG